MIVITERFFDPTTSLAIKIYFPFPVRSSEMYLRQFFAEVVTCHSSAFFFQRFSINMLGNQRLISGEVAIIEIHNHASVLLRLCSLLICAVRSSHYR